RVARLNPVATVSSIMMEEIMLQAIKMTKNASRIRSSASASAVRITTAPASRVRTAALREYAKPVRRTDVLRIANCRSREIAPSVAGNSAMMESVEATSHETLARMGFSSIAEMVQRIIAERNVILLRI
ncbi:MAG: hypothetical protein AAB853_05730, partial [Patescibacteria group bacterium]